MSTRPSKKSSSGDCSVESVGRMFQQIHKSAAHIQKCKGELLLQADENRSDLVNTVCHVVLLVLKESPRLAPDALRRHYTFLSEVCRGFRERFQSDEISIAVLKTVEPFHNAVDKTVRLSVVSIFDVLLKTVDQTDTTEERQNFYQNAAEILKLRVHDKHPPVREKAVSAVSCFQSGKRDCDVTQQLMVLLCTDTSADVRRQVLRCVCARKEFLDGYFHGMVRCVRDVVSRVRAEAWDAIARFHWKYVAAYATAKNVSLPELIREGLSDANKSVVIACRSAVTNCWLHRDYKDDCEAMLELVVSGGALEPYEVLCTELLQYALKHKKRSAYVINLEAVSATSLLIWRASAKLSADMEGDDETAVLLPLPQFSAVLQDTVYAYARPDVVAKTVKFKNVDDADFMLRILLSAFDIYEENGYLAHTDNTTRSSLLRIIGFLLKVVPDEDPALFVDVAIRSLKSLTERIPEEATKTITSSLDSLFRSLKLPQIYALGYDDVEAFGRKSRERHRELIRLRMKLRAGEATQEEHDQLQEEMDRDEKFLLRMQFIVLAFLSHSQRGENIPTFCSHVIQLGRRQDNEAVKVTSTTSLGLQCLVNPDTVHTFMPLILSDANEIAVTSENCVPVTALGVAFDLVMEYGLRFFDCPAHSLESSSNNNNKSGAGVDVLQTGAISSAEDGMVVRLQHERTLAQEDEHKVGGNNLLTVLRSFLRTLSVEKNAMAVVGFCKLLSCNRIPHGQVPEVIADILIHYMAYRQEVKANLRVRYMVDYLNKFLHSFASSHPARQSAVSQGGLVAFTVMLRHNSTVALRLIEVITKLSDAFILVQVRDIDPDMARQVARLADGENQSGEDSTLSKNLSTRVAATRTSTQSGRLSRELSRFSLHEHIACDLLIEISQNDSEEARGVCLEVLEKRMYFYAKELSSWFLFCAARALEAVSGKMQSRLQVWRDEAVARFSTQPDDEGVNAAKWEETIKVRECAIARLLDNAVAATLCTSIQSVLPAGDAADESLPQQTMRASSPLGKGEKKRAREMDTVFDIDSMLGRQRKKKNAARQ